MARRLVSEKTIKNKQGEVIINDKLTVAENGDVNVGKDLAVDGDVAISNDLAVEGKIVVNSADDIVDIHGQPIAGGAAFYVHDGYVEAGTGTYYNFKILSSVSTVYTDIYDLNGDNAKLFQISTVPAEQMAGFSVETDKSGNEYYTVTTVDGEYHEFETVTHFADDILG